MSKLTIPAEVMDKMTCLVCKKYLSVFPIYTKMDGSGGCCGRCPLPDPNNHVRDEAFENIARYLVFPCSHEGCKETMTPVHLEGHEACCVFRKYECPSKSYSKCDWKGALLGASGSDLKKHFQDKHADLLLTTPSFELIFNNTLEENMLLYHFEELFIVKKEIDARRGLFFCTVEHLRSTENSDTYMYFLRCESGNKDYFYRGPEKATKRNNTTKLTMDVLKERLQDPAVIIVNIEIIKSNNEDTGENNVAERFEMNINPNVDWQMLSELECPICLDYMLAPIYQCVRGHSICGKCKKRVLETAGNCPSCKQPFHDTQNFSLEKMSQLMVYPCKFHKSGCNFASKSAEIMVHEDSCEYGSYKCPVDTEGTVCEWIGSSSKVIEHVSNNHEEYLLKVSKIKVPFARNEPRTEVKFVSFQKMLFKIFFIYKQKKFFWTVQLVGPTKESKNYKFEVDVIDMTGDKKRFFMVGNVANLDDDWRRVQRPRGFVLFAALEQLEGFIREDQGGDFSFRIKVIKS
ncbi:unnamed protein product [Phaedon cochleariae]|uniref:RING-type E3 ubiquitin transferase n=1 Tax=Phaedon cochleariae TaxID=80249 RepID=A0A9P0DR71_PHACE|nr:unnamed protein product [Phaedon cochleariae]